MNRLAKFAAALAAVVLSGCQTDKSMALNCPGSEILATTSSLTEFKPGMQGDPSGELYTVELTGVKATCDFDKDEGTTDSSVEISFRVTRPPNGAEADLTVPYFLAAMQDGSKVLSKQILAAQFSFAPGQSYITFTETVPSMVIKLANGKRPYDYGLLAGLQLTREQLDFNDKSGPFKP